LRRILCTLFGHHRNSRRAQPWSEGWRAPCLLCGEQLVRESSGQWRVMTSEESWPSLAPFVGAPRLPFTALGMNAVEIGSGHARRGPDSGCVRHHGTDRPHATRNRRLADRSGEAEMFAIAFACCREVMFRLSDGFPGHGSAVNPDVPSLDRRCDRCRREFDPVAIE